MKETNMEHYRGEIEELKYSFSFINNEIKSCGKCCWDCEFHPKNREGEYTVCSPYKLKWLMSEYKPEPVLTEREKHFVEFVQDGYIARDGDDGFIHWFEEKPRKGTEHWIRCGVCTRLSSYSNNLFPFITWEDEESWAVEDLRKLKVADEG